MNEITAVEKMKKDMADAEERADEAHRRAVLHQQLQ